MFDRVLSVYNNAMAGDFFMLLLVVIWGLLMAGLCYKIAGMMGFKQRWQRISAVGGFVSLGAGVFVLLGRWAYKAFVEKEDTEGQNE